jgi:hypothetical protein
VHITHSLGLVAILTKLFFLFCFFFSKSEFVFLILKLYIYISIIYYNQFKHNILALVGKANKSKQTSKKHLHNKPFCIFFDLLFVGVLVG